VYAGKPAATVSICQCLMKRRSCHVDRTAVVSSTAAATLRQLVMFIVDKIVEEDRRMPLTVRSPMSLNRKLFQTE
jgi:hypothetical protein